MRQLPKSKILIVWEGGGCGHVFSIILIIDFQCLEDVFSGSALSGEILDVGIDWGDRSDGGSRGCGGDCGFSVSDLLGAIVPLGFSGCLRGAAFICAVSLFVASEAKSFSDALGMVCWGELFQANGVNIHGIRVLGGMRVGGE